MFGSTTLGIAYALVGAEALLAPAMPSSTARAGGWLPSHYDTPCDCLAPTIKAFEGIGVQGGQNHALAQR
jgi:di/tricarboxylate transporter